MHDLPHLGAPPPQANEAPDHAVFAHVRHPHRAPHLPGPAALPSQVMHSGSRVGSLFHVLPTTFTLPKEAAAFQEAFQRAGAGVEPTCTQPRGLNLWIVKPVGLSRGRGISIAASMRDVAAAAATPEEPLVVQRWVRWWRTNRA